MLAAIRANMLIGQYEAALEGLTQMMATCEAQQHYEVLPECYAYCAMIHYNNGYYEKSFEMTNYYETLCSRYQLPIVKAHYYPLIGVQYMLQQAYEEALVYFKEAASDAHERQDLMLYGTSQKMVVACLSELQQWAEAEQVLRTMLQAQHDPNTIEYAEWCILQLTLLDEKGDDARFVTLSNELLHHPMLQHRTYKRTRDYFEKTMVQFWTKRQQWQALVKQYETYIAHLCTIDVHDAQIDELFTQLLHTAERLDDDSHYSALSLYANHLRERQHDLLEQAVIEEDTEDLRALIHKDSLTGCYTRHYLEETVNTWLQTHCVTIAVFDCDHFKQVNDTYGHLAGDDVLKAIVSGIQPKLEKDAFLARYGGDEFVLATKGASTQCIDAFARVQHQQIDTDAGTITISLSMGIATSVAGESFDLLFAVADRALYEAKRAGRGRYVMADAQL